MYPRVVGHSQEEHHKPGSVLLYTAICCGARHPRSHACTHHTRSHVPRAPTPQVDSKAASRTIQRLHDQLEGKEQEVGALNIKVSKSVNVKG